MNLEQFKSMLVEQGFHHEDDGYAVSRKYWSFERKDPYAYLTFHAPCGEMSWVDLIVGEEDDEENLEVERTFETEDQYIDRLLATEFLGTTVAKILEGELPENWRET